MKINYLKTWREVWAVVDSDTFEEGYLEFHIINPTGIRRIGEPERSCFRANTVSIDPINEGFVFDNWETYVKGSWRLMKPVEDILKHTPWITGFRLVTDDNGFHTLFFSKALNMSIWLCDKNIPKTNHPQRTLTSKEFDAKISKLLTL